MKLKIMIMALLLLVGIGSAVNRLPATEFVGDVDMNDNFIISVNKAAGHGVTVGKSADCDFSTIQEAINYAESVGGKTIYVQNGTYPGNISLWADNILIIGEGQNTIITSDTSPAISIDSQNISIHDGVGNSGIKNLRVVGVGEPEIGIYFGNTQTGSKITLDGLYIEGFQKQIHMGTNSGEYNRSTFAHASISRCVIGRYDEVNSTHGIYIEYAIEADIIDNKIQGYNYSGIEIRHGDSVHIKNNNIISTVGAWEGGYEYPDYAIFGCIVSPNRCIDLQISGNAIEASNEYHIRLIAAGGTVSGVIINNNWLGGGDGGDISLEGDVLQTLIDSNVMRDKTTNATVANINIVGNSRNILIGQNYIESNYFGLLLQGSGENVIISGNAFTSNGLHPVRAIAVVGYDNTTISGNAFDPDVAWHAIWGTIYIHDTNSRDTRISDIGNPTTVNDGGIRTLINGLGTNSGDPSSTGNWNGYGATGVSVVDTETNKIYMYANGGWRALN